MWPSPTRPSKSSSRSQPEDWNVDTPVATPAAGDLPAGISLSPTDALTRGFVRADALAAPRGGAAGALQAMRSAEQLRQGFRIGALHLMVPYENGSELTEMPQLYRLPNTPDWFRGI